VTFAKSAALTPIAEARSPGSRVKVSEIVEGREAASFDPDCRGIFIYLYSGEVSTFPTANKVILDARVLSVFSGDDLLARVSRDRIWSAGNTEMCPVPS
jgi:hypothetical protein